MYFHNTKFSAMRKTLSVLFASIIFFTGYAQTPAAKVLWAFPITDYMVSLNDSVNVVQVVLPPQVHFVKDKQLCLTHGISRGSDVDTGSKGWGKCHLIKNQYNYFAIHMEAGKTLREGDLLYTFIPAIPGNYQSPLFFCASHNITFLDVEDSAFYKPADFLQKKSKLGFIIMINKMIADIRRTSKYYLENDTTLNRPIDEGPYKGGRILDVMAVAKAEDVKSFLGYVVARPRRYAGNKWKISETFATWLLNGAPTVVEN